MARKKIVFLSGAGVSAESGIATFRDSDGLWNNYRIEDVATYDAWLRNKSLVLDFYNKRREDAIKALPNEGHRIIAELEKDFDVSVITQNVDNLHEKAGSTNVLHLHGELFKARSTKNEKIIVNMDGTQLNLGDLASDGAQLRPHIVWFGEAVPMIEVAEKIVQKADIFVVIGTSLQVYPAAGLLHYVGKDVPKFIIDPNIPDYKYAKNTTYFAEKASVGMVLLKEKILNELL